MGRVCKVIYIPRHKRHYPPIWATIVPFIYDDIYDWCPAHMKRDLTPKRMLRVRSLLMVFHTGAPFSSYPQWKGLLSGPCNIYHMATSIARVVLRLRTSTWRDSDCAEQQVSSTTLTKNFSCHAQWPSKTQKKFGNKSWSVICDARPIR